MPSRTITIVSYGKDQKLQEIDDDKRDSMLFLDCSVYRDSCLVLLKKKFQCGSIAELKEYIQSVNTIADIYKQVQQWVNSKSKTCEPLTIYCMSDEGLFRSVALANILCDYLRAQGYDVSVFHSRLALLGVNISV